MDIMTRLDTPGMTPSAPPRGTNRRKFLLAGGAAAGLAAAAGLGGEYLQNKRFASQGKPLSSGVPASGNASASGGASVSGNAPAVQIGGPGVAQKPLPEGAELTDIPGLSAFYTPSNQFYRIDTALVVPKVSVQGWQLRIHGMVDRPVTLSFADLIKRPMLDQDITLTCVSDSVGDGRIGNARWQGTLLANVLKEAGIHPGATQIVMRDGKGMNLSVATAPVMDGRDSLLAIGMNGQALSAEHGFPVRVVVPGLYGYVSACKWVVDMELTTFGAFNSYYKKLGWAADPGPIKTESRIDTPGKGNKLAAGKVMIAGVAWAQHRGIEAVEVGVDGNFQQATLAAQDVLDSWRQWYFPWEATPGNHTLQVRATDKSGHTQTAVNHHTFPAGATGWHTIKVTVA
jgi:DMSO/TMAO reductase YedYZ molybdopterin-dependent catalytic subunit